jgi:hypothetical protein
MKPLGKGSFLKTLLLALGMDKDSVSPWPSHAETKPSGSLNCVAPGFVRTAWLKAEQAKANALMEIERRKAFFFL